MERPAAKLPQRALRYLALGDSYTIGESVEERDRWPVQLCALLREHCAIEVAAPTLVASTGWTTGELALAIREATLQGPFDLITLLIGVNNQYRGLGLDEYREQFHELLDVAIGYAAGSSRRVVVVSIPDWGVTPFAHGRDATAIAEEIDAFNRTNREESTVQGVRYVDVTACSRFAPHNRSLIAEDGLHPSGMMYRLWAELILPEARAVLSG